MAAIALCLSIGHSASYAAAAPSSVELTTRDARTAESNLAGVIADAVRAVDKSDIAFMPATAFAEVTLPKGNVTPADVVGALVFRGDTVVVVRLTGAQVRKALEHGLSLYPQKSSALLQVSGISATINPDAPKGSRVVSVRVGKDPISDTKTYTVAMPAPLARGALVYDRVWSRSDVEHDTGKTLEQAVIAYVEARPSLGKAEERLVFRK